MDYTEHRTKSGNTVYRYEFSKLIVWAGSKLSKSEQKRYAVVTCHGDEGLPAIINPDLADEVE